jgi:ankyrin repeat protein
MGDLGGHTRIVNMLLREDGIDPDHKDNNGQTPLSLAACNGHGAIVRLLLHTGRVNVDSKDKRWTNSVDACLIQPSRDCMQTTASNRSGCC